MDPKLLPPPDGQLLLISPQEAPSSQSLTVNRRVCCTSSPRWRLSRAFGCPPPKSTPPCCTHALTCFTSTRSTCRRCLPLARTSTTGRSARCPANQERALLTLAAHEQIHTPFWHSFRGLNNRIAFGSPAAMRSYGSRIRHVEAYLRSGHRLNAEEFLAFAVGRDGLQPRNASLVAKRLREERFSLKLLGGSALARVFWYDTCLSTECAVAPHRCAFDCGVASYDHWRGWPHCRKK
mmetsp:Transcript_25525/g.81903  ORF Transcript_25525/g.81903 Transcript_25525/m.81903 type:complete len:236 (+) Transcript_25525:100-807(+)